VEPIAIMINVVSKILDVDLLWVRVWEKDMLMIKTNIVLIKDARMAGVV
jgi:hypothetical protein